jgi:hypothetical protein
MSRLFHLTFMFRGVPKIRDIEPAFSDAEDDWIRLSNFSWIIWTPKGVEQIYQRIKLQIDSEDQFLLSKIELGESVGYLAPWIWDWINAKIPNSISIDPQTNKLLSPPK